MIPGNSPTIPYNFAFWYCRAFNSGENSGGIARVPQVPSSPQGACAGVGIGMLKGGGDSQSGKCKPPKRRMQTTESGRCKPPKAEDANHHKRNIQTTQAEDANHPKRKMQTTQDAKIPRFQKYKPWNWKVTNPRWSRIILQRSAGPCLPRAPRLRVSV